ncbi:CcdB family protein [Microvirga pudoricolor]|uniref:CcdB family protein n=1 Tax=Microvirga pudoricolor TaxID=2778729 RepID=UPI001950EC0C|nr:CcdB family protein [Microvirga pudoricolor]MBM6594055.1 CcdB family protein [Microvirga pudoricolor]
MAQFDLYTGVGRSGGAVVDLQAGLLDRLATRIVAPLIPRADMEAITGLTPAVTVNGNEFIVVLPEMAAVPSRELHQRIGSLADDQDRIKRALDILFFGI